MMRKRAFWISLPVASVVTIGSYYGLTRSPVQMEGPSVLAEDNQDFQFQLTKSKENDYKNNMVGYETYNHQYHIKRNDLDDFFDWIPSRENPTDVRTGHRKVNIIRDHSLKLETPCGSGTGWFLDYVLPKDGSYPTKWFIATNAHVISHMSFGSNDYEQPLPKRPGYGCSIRGSIHTPLLLWKERVNGMGENVSLESAKIWDELYGSGYSRNKHYYYSNALNYPHESHETSELLYYKENNPKLVYVPINFLGKGIQKFSQFNFNMDYYKDFAVLEVNFQTPAAAKLLTRGFFGKYDRNKGTDKSQTLNIFSEELLSSKTGDQLFWESYNDYFVAGYASNGPHPYKSTGNYSPIRKGAGRLTFVRNPYLRNMTNKYDQPLIGHVDVGMMDAMFRSNRVEWNGKPLMDWGYNYVLDNSLLSSGASGSLTTDKAGNVLGLYRMHDTSKNIAFVEPLRSKGIYKDGKVIVPGYDLIEGVPGQVSSYKSQIQKYYLSKGEETSLSRYRNWNK